MNERLLNENKNLPIINKKLIEYENNIKLLKDENIKLKKYNLDLVNEVKNLNQKLNILNSEINKKENNFNIETYNINSKLNRVAQEFQSSSLDFEKCKMEKNALIQEQEKFTNFINAKLNEINEFLIRAFNSPDISKLSEEFNNNNNIIGNNYYNSVNDIKFELVENSIDEMKKNILKFVLNNREKNDKFINEYNNISRDREILESHNSEIVNELNSYKQNQNEIEIKAKEMSLNYEKLRDSYTKLYNDFNTFTNSNTNYVNNMQSFLLELIEKINSTLGDKNQDNKERTLNEILKECISKLINEYKIVVKRLEENARKDEITFKKILEMEKLLEESQKIGKEYEAENRRLKTELERLNYRYNLLKISIDTVEYKIKSES
jgi:chromosome segregation ATPase